MNEGKTRVFSRDFSKADERREFKGHGYMDAVNFDGGMTFGRGFFEPGWKWSNDVKPLVETKSCEAEHNGYCLKGSMVVKLDSGEEFRIKAGDVYHIPSGHDAYVDGNETCELIDVTGAANYAQKKTKAA